MSSLFPRPNNHLRHLMIEQFNYILREATSSIQQEYFQLPVARRETPIYRERVYCYELYHQIRSRWPVSSGFSIGAEVDKSGHPIIRGNNLDYVKPDFIVHVPEDMGNQLLVMEVKPANGRTEGIKKDLTTLSAFLRRGFYENAYYLIYGAIDVEGFSDRLRTVLGDDNDFLIEKITFWHHPEPGTPAEKFDFCIRKNVPL